MILLGLLLSGVVAADSTPVRVLQAQRGVTGLAFSPDGSLLASSGLDGTVRVWSVRSWRLLHTYRAHTAEVSAVAFSADGRLLASTGGDGRVMVWDSKRGTLVRSLQFPSWCGGVAFIRSDQLAVGCADLRLRVLDVHSWQTTKELEAPGNLKYSSILGVVSSRDGKLLASVSPLRVWNVETWQPHAAFPAGIVYSLTFSPDGTRLAGAEAAGGADLWTVATRQWDRLETRVPRSSSGPAGQRVQVTPNMPTRAVAFSRDGRVLATGGIDFLVRLWQVSPDSGSTKQVQALNAHTATVSALCFSPDDAMLASGGLDGVILIWRLP